MFPVLELDPVLFQAAAEDIKNFGEDAGLTRRLVHGATLGADNTILAAMQARLEAYKRGVSLGEGYNCAKVREDRILNPALILELAEQRQSCLVVV